MFQVLLYHKPQLLPLHLAHTWLGTGGPAETRWGYGEVLPASPGHAKEKNSIFSAVCLAGAPEPPQLRVTFRLDCCGTPGES